MIPQKLVLKNFLSHPHSVLNLEGLHTACICGVNGAGKSSLLEAITWVLWGKSRVESEDDLIYLGAKEAQVDFVLINRGNCYRVIRTRTRGHASNLELQILSEGKFRSLTERGLRATQQIVIDHLKLDYETFIHSAYLRQGKADAFMLKRPQERKQVLAEILQLSQYDRLAEKAKDIARMAKGESNAIGQQMQNLQIQINQSDRVAVDLIAIKQQEITLKSYLEGESKKKQLWEQEGQQHQLIKQKIDWLNHQIEQISHDIKLLQQQQTQQYHQCQQLENVLYQRSVIEQKYQQYLQIAQEVEIASNQSREYQALSDRKQQLHQQLASKENELRLRICHFQTQWDTFTHQQQQLKGILDRRAEITTAQQQYQAAKTKLANYDRVHSQAAPLQQRLHLLQRQIEQQRAHLVAKRDALQHQYDQLQTQLAQKLPLQQSLQEIDEQISFLQKKQVYQQRVHEKGLERRDFLERLKVRLTDCEQKMQKTEFNLHQIHEPNANCPLCDQTLEGKHRIHVLQKHQQTLAELNSDIWLIKAQQSTSDTEISILREEYTRLRQELQPYSRYLEQKGSLQSQLQATNQAADRLTQIQQEITTIDRQLSDQNFALEIHREATLLTDSIERLGYDERDHALLRSEVDRWRWSEIKAGELKQSQHQWDQIAEKLPLIQQQIQTLTDRVEQKQIDSTIQVQIETYDREIKELNYDLNHHCQLQKLKEENAGYILKNQELNLAEQQFPGLQNQYEQTRQTLQTKIQNITNLQQEKQNRQQEISQYPDREPQITEITIGINDLRNQLDNCIRERGKLEQLSQQIMLFQQQIITLTQQLKQVDYRQRIHHELSLSFGKNGIQTLVIETIIPQIEAEANHILGQLTNYQYNIRFITQKSGKRSDKFIDTLEIEIADHQGTRPYETYSGGEAFRINFALRLALSRILAQRTGGTLQTLIIDEGFGSQDEEGCDRLVGAIEAVAQDFTCILIITHIPKLKEAFTTLIEVTKTNNGSHVQLVL